MKRGEIYYINKASQSGSEQIAGRPAIIVSNDDCNANSPVIEVVFLTTAPKHDLPTHVNIYSSTKPSTAICEQISSIDVARVANFVAVCTEDEMSAIDEALRISLGLENDNSYNVQYNATYDELIATRAERDTYKKMYDQLLKKLIGGTK